MGRAETPIISYPTEPVSVTNVLGETIGFDVTVDNDDGTFRYGWRKNGKSVLNPDGDGAGFAKNVSIGNDAGTYTCYVDNPLNESALSAPFYLTVLTPPVVTSEPKDQTVIAGNNVTLTVGVNTALFPTNFTYRWQLEGMDLFDDGEQVSGADTLSLTLTSVGPGDEGNYSVNIFNDATMLSLSGEPTTSTNAYLTVVVPPTISFDPDDDIETVGSPAEFSVVVDSETTDTDQNPLTYQWRKNAINITLAANPTATNDTLTIPAAQMADEGDYTVVVKNTGGAVTSAPARLMFLPDLTDVSPGTDFAVAAGTNVTFSATANGSPPLVFQWFIDDVPIPGATSSNYTFRVGSIDQNGGYSVQVSNYVCGLAGVRLDESINHHQSCQRCPLEQCRHQRPRHGHG
ncbi:MAG: immunoglobulin domain-containing protein [Verrucomicrobia bacterium]|nr:immunoglobulin domain-containing protein [Verrucomicrobiota bacterium]